MLVLPMGLGTKRPKFPVITFGLAVLMIVLFFLDKGHFRATEVMTRIDSEPRFLTARQNLFVDYCAHHKISASDCQGLSIFLDPSSLSPKEIKSKSNKKPALNVKSPKDNPLVTPDFKLLKNPRYLRMIRKFQHDVDAPPPFVKKLPAYAAYAKIEAKNHKKVVKLFKEERILSRSNIQADSLLFAQFRHGSTMHLFGNLLIFVIFGVYVEQRLRSFNFLLAYMACGSIGLFSNVMFFLPPDMPLLGASANIAGVMGMFYVFFFHSRLRLWVGLLPLPGLGKFVWAPVKFAIPLAFIVSDLTGALESLLPSGGSGNVAHIAHLAGLFFGMGLAFAINNFMPLPGDFIYPSEIPVFKQLLTLDRVEHKLILARRLLDVNEGQHLVRQVALTAIVTPPLSRAQPRSDVAELSFLVSHLDAYCKLGFKRKELGSVYQILARMPLRFAFDQVLGTLNQTKVLTLGDVAIEQNNPLLAVRLYDAFLIRHKGTVKERSVRQSVRDILSKIESNETNRSMLKGYLSALPHSALSSELTTRLEFMHEHSNLYVEAPHA